jgi:hypothetical protein
MEALEVVCMQDVPCRADDFLQKTQVVFVWRNQVAATRRRHLACKPRGKGDGFISRSNLKIARRRARLGRKVFVSNASSQANTHRKEPP